MNRLIAVPLTRFAACALITVALLVQPMVSKADAEEMTAVEEILEILREMQAVDQAKYQRLKAKLAAEQQAEQEQAAAMEKAVEKPANSVNVTWRNGPSFETEDKNFRFDISGRIHNHYGGITSNDELTDAFGDEADEFRGFIRRARLGVSGKAYGRFGFKAEYDFAGGDADFADVYVQAYDIPLAGTVTVGHFKEPLSVDEMTSTNNNWFIERSQANEAFYQSRDTGVKVQNTVLDNRLGYAIAGMTVADSAGNGPFGDTDYKLVGRIWGLPLASEDMGKLHLGLSYRHLFLNDEADTSVRYRSRPETQVTSLRFVDTGAIDAEDSDLFVGELAWAKDRWNVVGEYFHQMVNREDGDDVSFWGAYGLVSYFLTDDSRPYSVSRGGFSGVKPKNPVTLDGGGWGAWEVAGRYSILDLEDDDIEGGQQSIITAGLNWYPTSMFRLMLNYNYVNVDDRTVNMIDLDGDDAHVLQTRFQVAF